MEHAEQLSINHIVCVTASKSEYLSSFRHTGMFTDGRILIVYLILCIYDKGYRR